MNQCTDITSHSLFIQKQPQWFAYECACAKGKLILHHFEVKMWKTVMEETEVEGVFTPVEYMVFTIECERCGKRQIKKIPVENINWFLDRLTPWCTHDPELYDQILWYWDDGTASEVVE